MPFQHFIIIILSFRHCILTFQHHLLLFSPFDNLSFQHFNSLFLSFQPLYIFFVKMLRLDVPVNSDYQSLLPISEFFGKCSDTSPNKIRVQWRNGQKLLELRRKQEIELNSGYIILNTCEKCWGFLKMGQKYQNISIFIWPKFHR